jgi:2-polyprenyl-3-methyl-5-hydroxy-6-metoxy-1,4-benzoquinol methylase
MENKQHVDCLLCGNTATLKEDKYPGYQEPDTFGIYHCAACDTAFSYPRVATEHIYQQIYQNAEKVPGYDRYWRYKNTVKNVEQPLQFLADQEESYWGPVAAIKNLVKDKQSAKILEVGCGMGYLTYSLIQDGYNAQGIDISQNAVDEATRQFGNHYICADIAEYAQQHKGYYDVVVLTEVVEHVENPLNFVKNAVVMLNSVNGGGQSRVNYS